MLKEKLFYPANLHLVKTFLNGDLDEHVGMVPEGVRRVDRKSTFWNLMKSVYELKQVSRTGNENIDSFLKHLDFTSSPWVPCFKRRRCHEEEIMTTALSVDDLLLADNSKNAI